MMTIDYGSLTQNLFKALRGARSASWASRRCGYRFNKFSRWERGEAKPTWDEFVDVAAVLRVDLPRALRTSFRYEGAADQAPLLRYLIGGTPIAELARMIGASTSTVQRWVAASHAAPLEAVLKLVEARNYGLGYFLKNLLGTERAVALAPELGRLEEHLEQRWAHPYVSGVPRCFELQAYLDLPRHERGFLARQLGLSLEQEDQAIALLSASGVLRYEDGKYRVAAEAKRTNTSADLRERQQVLDYWLLRAREELRSEQRVLQPLDEIWGYRTFASTPELRRRVVELSRDYYAAVLDAIKETGDGPFDQVSILGLQVFAPRPER